MTDSRSVSLHSASGFPDEQACVWMKLSASCLTGAAAAKWDGGRCGIAVRALGGGRRHAGAAAH